jgi:hypothetical protein
MKSPCCLWLLLVVSSRTIQHHVEPFLLGPVTSKLPQAVMLLTGIRVCRDTDSPEWGFPYFSADKCWDITSKLGHGHFIPVYFELIVLLPPFDSMITVLDTDSLFK